MTYRGPGSRSGNAVIGCLLVLVVAVVVFGVCLAVAPYYTTQIWWGVRESLFVVIPLLVVAVLAFAAASAADNGNRAGAGGFSLLAVVAFLGACGFWVLHSYAQESTYVASVKVVNDPVPALAYRPPFNVAEAQARPDLGDINGDTGTTTYLPDRKEFTTPVNWRGSFTGYETLLEQHVSDTGRNTHQTCEFSRGVADRRFGGLFSHSLGRLINSQARFVNWDDGDVYAYCDPQGTPQVVVPLKAQSGLFVVTEHPAGVAVYNGRTGDLSIVTDPAQIAKIPGPTYPLSIAAAQRESTGAIHGLSDWWWNRAGWELPDDIHDINSGNVSDYVLGTADKGQPLYVSLLTGRGSASAISAISTVDARQTGDGLAPVVVHHTNPSWLAPASVLDRVHANFGDVFMAQPQARVFELAPLDGNRWVATIGLPQNLLYRVTGVGDLSTDACLVKLTGEQLRCGGATNLNGSGPGVAIGQLPGAPASAPAPASSDMKGLTAPQLVDLINRASQELATRTGGK
jgi:hypothetical protein